MHASVDAAVRCRFELAGQVQGVGFRPYVYRLAGAFGLGGYVENTCRGATIEVEGAPGAIEAFAEALPANLPPLARISRARHRPVPPRGEKQFCIRHSEADQSPRAEVTPDAATCGECLAELFEEQDRRHRYAFINCTNCGPRYSIMRAIPYDRPNTTMTVFRMCEPCRREYAAPADRRFHAQPIACPDCGPVLQLFRVVRPARRAGAPARLESIAGDAIGGAASMLRDGSIVAVKGIGGYHLACRADRQEVVRRLRERKLRDGKPLALMVADLAMARRTCRLSDADVAALTSPAAPIVLAPKRPGHGVASCVAPDCRDFGIMLPYAPLHHLLFAEGLGPLVMTSANLAGQPLTFQDEDAVRELSDVADAFLTHNREIFRPIDDSVVFTFRGAAVPIRRARGQAPKPIRIELARAARQHRRILAVGAELKSTVCLLSEGRAVLSEHLGDLTRAETYRHFVTAIERLKSLFDFRPDLVACDLHPQYLSTQYAQRLGIPRLGVQHHHAHIASVMAEWGEAGPVVGLACDGVGYGTDGAVWGCEVLRCERGEFRRLGHLEYFPLVGGDAAAIETWRPAVGLLRAVFGSRWRDVLHRLRDSVKTPLPRRGRGWVRRQSRRAGTRIPPSPNPSLPGTGVLLEVIRPEDVRTGAIPLLDERVLDVAERQFASGLNVPLAASLGRVFDGVAFLVGLCARNLHEAQAAMALEGAAGDDPAQPYPYRIADRDGLFQMSLTPAVAAIVADVEVGVPAGRIAARFHETVADLLAASAVRACEREGVSTVALSGGCFANRRVLRRTVELLEHENLKVLYNLQVPSGDGGLALGQAFVAMWKARDGEP